MAAQEQKDPRTLTQAAFEMYGGYIRKYCAYKLSSFPEQIEDAMQETFTAYMEYLLSGRDIEYPKAWLTMTARNKCADIFTGSIRDNARTLALDEDELDRQNVDYGTWDDHDKNAGDEDIDRLREELLGRLTDYERTLIEEKSGRSLTVDEMARRHKLSYSAMRMQLFRLREKVRRMAADAVDGGDRYG